MFSTRRAVMECAPEEYRGALLRYRRNLDGTYSPDDGLAAVLWVTTTEDGGRLRRFLWWARLLRNSRRIRADEERREHFIELCDVVSRMQKRLLDDSTFRSDEKDAKLLVGVLRLADAERKARERTKRANEVRAEHLQPLEDALSALSKRSPHLNLAQALRAVQVPADVPGTFLGVSAKTAKKAARKYFKPAPKGRPKKLG